MKKIPTALVRDPDDRAHVLKEVTPGCEWVFAREGTPTRKYDGTCVLLADEMTWWARREVKPGKRTPPNFYAVEHDETTGKTVGWEPIEQSPFAKFHGQALEREPAYGWQPGTYELCGPKINGNPENFGGHELVSHVEAEVLPSLDAWSLIEFCRERGYEGVVWHHPDGRMAKLKVRDLA